MSSGSGAANHTALNRLRPVAGRHNALLKELRHCFARAELSPDGYCAIEGARMVEEAIRSRLRLKAVFVGQSGVPRAEKLLAQVKAQVETLLVPDSLLGSALPSETPQGVAALVRMPQFQMDEAFGKAHADAPGLTLIVAGLQDPGNLGTLVRSAEAFGAFGMLLAEGTVSPYNAKTVRAAAGSLFRLPVIAGKLADFMAALRLRGMRLLATSSHKGAPLEDVRFDRPLAVLIGGEGAGVPRQALADADEIVAIPHSGRVESLNAGVAGSILLYEAARQRRLSRPPASG
jgi:TrmH family RNA methyltransferase